MDNQNEIQTSEQQHMSALLHPWRRFFARSIDLSIYSIIWSCIQFFVFRWHPDDNIIITLLTNYLVFFILFIFEPLLLCTWGTTPGKAIFGLVLRSQSGNKLTYSEALSRCFVFFSQGEGYNIPIYNLVCNYKSYQASLNEGKLYWNYESNQQYYLIDLKFIRKVVFIASNILILVLVFIINLQSQMPLNRGNITPVEYAENINDILKRPNMHKGIYMDENGHWIENNNDYNDYNLYTSANQLPNHQLKVENGVVNGVSFIFEKNQEGEHIFPASTVVQKLYITFAFLGSQKATNCFSLNSQEVESMLKNMENFDIEINGIRIKQEVDYAGYLLVGSDFWSEDGKEQRFRMVFSMEKIE